jgi:hypothetical protein
MTDFEKLLEHQGIAYAVLSSPDGARWQEFGDRHAEAFRDLLAHDAPTRETMPQIVEWMEGMVLPQVVAQGEQACLYCRPAPDLIVILYLSSDGNSEAQMLRAFDVAERLEAVFAASPR